MKLISQGTISILFGSHSVMHSFLVIRSWKILYGKYPRFWQIICILLHDIGHIGKNYLDNYEEKKKHWILGARIAGWLFGKKGYDLIAGHDIHSGIFKSDLYKPDKYSWYIAPKWWLWMNIFFERKICQPGKTWAESVDIWKKTVAKNIESGRYASNHVIYLESMKENGWKY